MAMRIRRFIIFIVAVITALYAEAQSSASEINAIKRDSAYITADGTKVKRDDAINEAKEKLELLVSDWVTKTYSGTNVNACLAKTKEHCSLIETTRGNLIRAFVYVRKSDIKPIPLSSDVIVVKVSPKKDAVSTNQSDKMHQDLVSGNHNQPVIQGITLSSDENQMKEINSFYDIEPYIRRLKANNRLNGYGKYATMPTDSSCHIFVYDKNAKVVAVLRKTSSEFYLNLNTLVDDNIKNYKNCGAIWFQIK